MPYFKALVYIPGGKELKIEKNIAPDELYHSMRAIKEPEIVSIFADKLDLSDELHKQLQRPKTFSTYVVYGGHFNEVPESHDIHDVIMFGLQNGNLLTPIETVYGYQILRLEYLVPDEPIAPEYRAEPGENNSTEEAED